VAMYYLLSHIINIILHLLKCGVLSVAYLLSD
jgi:hypothetical protein